MRPLARLTLIFSLLFAFFITGLPFLSRQFGLFPLMKTQDAVDLFTPLILIPVYWQLFRSKPARQPGSGEVLVFILLAVLWVEGQAIHLAANSIGHYADAYAGSDLGRLTHFYDEALGHYLWHAGIIGLSFLLIYRQWGNPLKRPSTWPVPEIAAGILHGLCFALMVLEGTTVPLGLPAAALVVVWTIARGRRHLTQRPVLVFFFVAYAAATMFFLLWRVYWGCFIEPLEVLEHLGAAAC